MKRVHHPNCIGFHESALRLCPLPIHRPHLHAKAANQARALRGHRCAPHRRSVRLGGPALHRHGAGGPAPRPRARAPPPHPTAQKREFAQARSCPAHSARAALGPDDRSRASRSGRGPFRRASGRINGPARPWPRACARRGRGWVAVGAGDRGGALRPDPDQGPLLGDGGGPLLHPGP